MLFAQRSGVGCLGRHTSKTANSGILVRKGTPREISDFLSQCENRRLIHFLQGGRPRRCPYPSPAPWAAVFVTNVRASVRTALGSISPGGARLPRFWAQRLARPENIR